VQSYTPFSKSAIVLLTLTILTCTSCRENPQRAAQKQAAKAVSAALQTYQRTSSFEEAQKELQNLDAEAAGQDTAIFLKAGFSYTKASTLQTQLPNTRKQIENNIAALSKTLDKISGLGLETAELNAAVNSHKEAIDSITAQLKGTESQPGLSDQAHELENELARLQEQKAGLDNQAKQTQDQANKLQRDSADLLRKAQSAQGDEKLKLQQQAYALLSGENGGTSQAKILAQSQGFADQAAAIQSRINEVQPKLKYLQDAITAAREKLTQLENATLVTDAQARMAQIETELAELSKQAQDQLSTVLQAKQDYEKAFTEISGLYTDAANGFKSSSSQAMDQLAKIAQADASFRSALLTSDYAISLNHIAARLAVLPQIEGVSDSANAATEQIASAASEMISKAIEDYNDSANTYDRIRARQELGKTVKSAQLLALDQMAQLAVTSERSQVAADALARAKELIDEQIETDRSFIDTPPAKLYYQLSGTTPPPPPVAPDTNAPAADEDESSTPAEANAITEPNSPDTNSALEEVPDANAEPSI